MTASLGSTKSESLSAAPLSVRSIEQHLLFSAFHIFGANHATCGPAAWLLVGTGSGRPLGLTGRALRMAAPTGENVCTPAHVSETCERRKGKARWLRLAPRLGWGGMEHQSNDARASGFIAKWMAGIIGETELISLSRQPR